MLKSNLMEIEEDEVSTNSQKKVNILGLLNQKRTQVYQSPNETRLLNDLKEIEKDSSIFNIIKIRDNPKYSKNEITGEISMIIEFINVFSIKTIFKADYPFSAPQISFFSGKKLETVFDIENNKVKLILLQERNWSPIKGLKDIIRLINFQINLNNDNNLNLPGLNFETNQNEETINFINNSNNIINTNNNTINFISNNKINTNESINSNNNFDENYNYDMNVNFWTKKRKYGKRKWKEYLCGEKHSYGGTPLLFNELKKNIKIKK